ncbi:MAG: hypothetical protein PHN29_07840, partial [Endomicrobiaceae bacterium]|nr:hypothetical protein [Endomicrobiaceae bacterium]
MTTPLQKWVKDLTDLMTPDKVYWMNGSDKEAKELAKMAETETVNGTPILTKLNDKEFPNSYWHRSNPNDVARTEHLTYVCTPQREEAGFNNIWMDPSQAKEKMNGLFKG